jgi:hypothetical protein
MMSNTMTTKYPLLQEILDLKNLQLQATFSITDVATIFGVSVRAIQNRVANGQLPARDLPGHARFLPQDLEGFLLGSKKGRRARGF